ncbi:hypothetical protein CesoFtcFv8_010669 [Champsocephalus esox]|uniref:Uncharacterized protein n=1 Tax=Champsocephalus esox TaxID=159716 RepID=A0AAN8H0Q9_9TELE|nr:hypothetical protein CesoFtcFv8_010669 [Champsocephalus esox]
MSTLSQTDAWGAAFDTRWLRLKVAVVPTSASSSLTWAVAPKHTADGLVSTSEPWSGLCDVIVKLSSNEDDSLLPVCRYVSGRA